MPNSSPTEPPLLTAAQAADLIGVSRITVMRMLKEGRLAYVHKLPGLTGAYLLNPAEVERVRAERKAAA